MVFSLGGLADKPYTEPNESRHITRMNYIAKMAKKQGCLVYKAHNKPYTELMQEMKEFVSENNIDQSYKFHFSFSDHGSSEKIPLSPNERYTSPEKFFQGVNDFIPKDSHVTYATHICWGGNLSTQAENPDLDFTLCGGSSVDRDHLSNAWNNPKRKKNETLAAYNARKFSKREKEYLGAGWKATDAKNSFWGYKPFEYDVSILDYHYAGMKKDTTNAARGGSLSSTLFAREQLLDSAGVDAYFDLEPSLDSYPDFYNAQNFSTAPLIKELGNKKSSVSCTTQESFDTGSDEIKSLAMDVSKVLDVNKQWLNQNMARYPFLQNYSDLLEKERQETSSYNIQKELSDAHEIYKNGIQKLKPLNDKAEDNSFLSQLALKIEKDQKTLSKDQFKNKYKKYFGKRIDDVWNHDFSTDPEWNNDHISGSIYMHIDDEWEVYRNRIKNKIKPLAARIRLENDITIMRRFLKSPSIDEAAKKKFKRMVTCENQSFI